jgi:serine/threonine protein kinase
LIGKAAAVDGADATSWAFEHGEEIGGGRFALGLLGGGEICETWLAWDRHLFAVVAVKVVRPDRLPHGTNQLRDEVEALSSLDHPVIVRAFGADLDCERPHVVLEHLEGPTLRDLVLDSGAQSLEQLLPLGLQLCSALHYLREEGWVHLDVKARNVVMGGQARLLDLSLARRVDDAAVLDELLGTPAYMSPEQCDPVTAGGVGPAADVWGLGVTLFEGLAGARPFAESDDEDDESLPLSVRYPQVVAVPPPLPAEVPGELVAAVLQCLEPEPGDRPTPEELAFRLEPLVAALPAPVLGPRRRPRLR